MLSLKVRLSPRLGVMVQARGGPTGAA
jgi:hypothetical protein